MRCENMEEAERLLKEKVFPSPTPRWMFWSKQESELTPLKLEEMALSKKVEGKVTRLLYRNVNIEFLAVWDNVKSLSLPRLPFSTLLDMLNLGRRLRLVDSTLPSSVKNALHALALHEHRASFSPTVWRPHARSEKGKLIQCWFLGCHGDVGGGSAGTVVFAHITLVWMLSQLKGTLTFDLSELQSTFGIPEQASIQKQHDEDGAALKRAMKEAVRECTK